MFVWVTRAGVLRYAHESLRIDTQCLWIGGRGEEGCVCMGWFGSRGEGWWFGPGDCKSLWPALMSSGWQRCLSPRHSSTCPSRPPYWSHIVRHPTPPRTLFYSYAHFCSYTVKVTYSPFLTFQEKECLWLYFLFFSFSRTFSFLFILIFSLPLPFPFSFLFLAKSFPVSFYFLFLSRPILSFPFSCTFSFM